MEEFDISRMMDRYVYDYFVKRNMHGAAEIFRNEANLDFDPEAPPAIDVPEGFLHEWWTMNYECDFFREWVNQNVKPRLEATQEHNASQSGQFLLNLETNKQLLVNSSSAISTGSKSMALDGRGKAPLIFSPSTHQEGPLTATLGICTPINCANTIGHISEPLVHATLKTENTVFSEETDPLIENLVSSFWVFEDQKELYNKLALGEKIAGSTSQALVADDTTSETSDCTSKIPSISADAEVSTVHQLDSNKEN